MYVPWRYTSGVTPADLLLASMAVSRYSPHAFLSFISNFLEDVSPFVGSLVSLFWTSCDVCPGFQSCGGSLTCMIPQIHLKCVTC